MEGFDYNKKNLEYIPCNLCGGNDFKIMVINFKVK